MSGLLTSELIFHKRRVNTVREKWKMSPTYSNYDTPLTLPKTMSRRKVSRRKVSTKYGPTKTNMMITLLNITFAILGVAIAVVPICVARKIHMKSEARIKEIQAEQGIGQAADAESVKIVKAA